MGNQQPSSGQHTEIQHKVDLEPVGLRTLIEPGMTLLDAARRRREIALCCGGVGASANVACGWCAAS